MKREQNLKMVVPFNTDRGGVSRCVTAGYYKYGVQTLLTGDYGTSGTAVLEIADKCNAGR